MDNNEVKVSVTLGDETYSISRKTESADDAKSVTWTELMKTFLNVLNGKKELVIGSHDKMPRKYLDCFSGVYMIKNFRYKNRDFVCIHCCPRVWEKSHYGSICLFAHSHGRLKTHNLSFDVGVDVPENRYSPISMDEILERVSLREAQMERAGRIRIEERERNGKKSKFKIFYQDDLAYFNPDLARVKIDMEGY